MAGRHSFDRLRAGLTPSATERASRLTDAMEQDLSLAELRRARAMTQEQLAVDLHVGQASIAKLERRSDMYLSTPRRFVEAMGEHHASAISRAPHSSPIPVTCMRLSLGFGG